MESEILELWEESVRAAHDFLSEDDIAAIKPQVRTAIHLVDLFLIDCGGKIAAFAGISGEKLEMLFVHPDARGAGHGKILLKRLLALGVGSVDVNEQNGQALGFYRHLGFEVYSRSELDSQGNPFPLLHMRLESKS